MALDFNGTTDRVDWANIANLAGSAMSISMWVNPDAVTAVSYLECFHDAGDTGFGIIFWVSAQTIRLTRNAGTDMLLYSNNFLTASAWQNLVVTHDGVITTAASAHIYRNNSEVTYATTTNGVAPETAHTGSWSTGGRIFDDTRCFNGKIAEVGIWNRVLDAGEITALSLGYSPLMFRSGLLKYTDLITTKNIMGAAASVVDGTTAFDHPRMLYAT